MVIVVTYKHQKTITLLKLTPFLVVEFSNNVTFLRNVRFDIILTPVTIIKKSFISLIVLFRVTS